MDIIPWIIVITMGAPLVIVLWLLVKLTYIRTKTIIQLRHRGESTKEEYGRFLLLTALVFIILLLIIFLFIDSFVPNLISDIPIVVKMLVKTFIFVIFSCVAAFFLGLKDVVRASGSASDILRTLSRYISDAMNIDKSKNQNKDQTSETKDADNDKISKNGK